MYICKNIFLDNDDDEEEHIWTDEDFDDVLYLDDEQMKELDESFDEDEGEDNMFNMDDEGDHGEEEKVETKPKVKYEDMSTE